MTALLIALAPLIVQAGLKLIDWFVADGAKKAAAKTAFIAAIQAHLDDALKSVQAHDSYDAQTGDLKKNPPAPAKPEVVPPLPIAPPPVKTRPFNDYDKKILNLWNTMQIKPEHLPEVESAANSIIRHSDKYVIVATKTGVPWWLIGCIHQLESGGDFTTHLHNGDPLTARTVHVPAGRPPTGNPPFDWIDSAVDALQFDGLTDVKDWDLVKALREAESYNGLGYMKRGVNSPYVWSYTNQYTSGLFTSDGNYNPGRISEQCGIAPIMLELKKNGANLLEVQPA